MTDSNKKNIVSIIREIISRRYTIGNEEEGRIFRVLNMRDYLALHMIHDTMQTGKDRVYLKEIAEELNLPMKTTSSVISGLNSKGLLYWSHDGAGEEGTYVEISERGLQLLTDQDEILHGFYSTVVEKFGIDHAAQLISLLREFDQIVKDEKKSLEHT